MNSTSTVLQAKSANLRVSSLKFYSRHERQNLHATSVRCIVNTNMYPHIGKISHRTETSAADPTTARKSTPIRHPRDQLPWSHQLQTHDWHLWLVKNNNNNSSYTWRRYHRMQHCSKTTVFLLTLWPWVLSNAYEGRYHSQGTTRADLFYWRARPLSTLWRFTEWHNI